MGVGGGNQIPFKNINVYKHAHIYTQERILKRYVGNWNLFGLDIMNECHDHASWGTGNPMTDFNSYVERFMLFINEKVPEYRGLFFVEGVSTKEKAKWRKRMQEKRLYTVQAALGVLLFFPLIFPSHPPTHHPTHPLSRSSLTEMGAIQGLIHIGGAGT